MFESLLVLLMVSTGLWALGYSLELAAASPFWYWVWGVLQYIGIATAPPLFFLLMIHYAGIENFLTKGMHAAPVRRAHASMPKKNRTA